MLEIFTWKIFHSWNIPQITVWWVWYGEWSFKPPLFPIVEATWCFSILFYDVLICVLIQTQLSHFSVDFRRPLISYPQKEPHRDLTQNFPGSEGVMKRKALHGLFDDIVQVGMENWQLGFPPLFFQMNMMENRGSCPEFSWISQMFFLVQWWISVKCPIEAWTREIWSPPCN